MQGLVQAVTTTVMSYVQLPSCVHSIVSLDSFIANGFCSLSALFSKQWSLSHGRSKCDIDILLRAVRSAGSYYLHCYQLCASMLTAIYCKRLLVLESSLVRMKVMRIHLSNVKEKANAIFVVNAFGGITNFEKSDLCPWRLLPGAMCRRRVLIKAKSERFKTQRME